MNSSNSTDDGSLNNIINLQIQGKYIKCSRTDLIRHSDYFKAMFEGNFMESSRNVIPLDGIEVEAMDTILKLLWDREYVIDENNILSVLQAACMLQFLEIKEICIEQIQNILSVKNCLKIWLYTEYLDLKSVYLKAKLIALLEFVTVKDCDDFLELRLEEIINYVGNRNLQCTDEMIVFNALMRWYHNASDKNSKVLFALLQCIDFTKMSEDQIDEIIKNCEIEENQDMLNVLQCVSAIKKDSDFSNLEPKSHEKARLLLNSKNRNLQGFPCILVNSLGVDLQRNLARESTVLFYDKFKRKRKYNVVQMLEFCPNTSLSVLYIDVKLSILKKLFDIEPQECSNLDGFKMLGYKQFVFLIGGEYLLGKGDWNLTFYMFDIIKEKWSRKDSLPFPRRHFEACVSGNYFYIVGGTGPFRIVQENIFWYNIVEEKWGKIVKLPCSGRQIRCCAFYDSLFILDINNKCGYSFNPDTQNWSKFDICDNDNVLPSYSNKLSVFSYKSNLYIKESRLYQLQLQGSSLIIIKQNDLPNIERGTCQVESVLCNNMLYSVILHWIDESNGQSVSLDSLNLDTLEISSDFVKANDDVIEIDNEVFKFRPFLSIFNVFHQNLVDGNDLIKD